jgi:DNA-binding NarL/FixJ family response regulator
MIAQLLAERLDQLKGLHVVAVAHTAAEGIQACVEHRPDLLLLDLNLPDAPGTRVAEALQLLHPQARMIVISGQANTFLCPEHLAPMLLAVVDKTGSCADLLEEIGLLLPTPNPATAQADAISADRLQSLTRRQRQILQRIGQGASSREVALQLGVSLETVNTHRRQIAARLGIRGAALVRCAVLHADLL